MARFTNESKERVKDSVDILEIVSAYTDLQQRGQDFWGNCPFHDERTPSFKVNPRDKLYYCFGCEASGDVFRFVEEKEGLTFPEVVESLAERYGVEVEREDEDPQAEARRRRKAKLWELLELTAKYYERYLWESQKAAKARAYLEERGLKEDVLRRFGVGMAPSAWDQVLTGSQRRGIQGRGPAGGRADPEGQAGRALRPLPEPDHLPHPRPARACARLRGAGAEPGLEAQVPELSRGRALPEEQHALWDRPRPRPDREGSARHPGRGIHRRAGVAPGGGGGGRRDHGNGDHTGTGHDARRLPSPSSWHSTRTVPARTR